MAVRQTLSSLPLASLIGAPLEAAQEAQTRSASSLLGTMRTFGFKKGGKTRTLDVVMERPIVEAGGQLRNHEVQISVPLLSFISFAQLQIEDLSVEFTVEISEQRKRGSKDSAEENTNQTVFYGRVTTSNDMLRESSTSATYKVNLLAKGADVGEGWKKLVDILCTSVEPRHIPVDESL